jgi:hypothetical protein
VKARTPPNRSFDCERQDRRTVKRRGRPPFWQQPPHPQYDVVRLTRHASKGRFETIRKVEEYYNINIKALRRDDGCQHIADRIESCSGSPCESPLCPYCARKYRRWFTGQVLRIADGVPGTILTLLLEEVPASRLLKVEISRLHDRLRKRLTRAGIIAAIGGTEAKYEARRESWIVHVHLVAFGVDDAAIRRLKRMAQKDGLKRPVMAQPLRDRAQQISYLQKFSTYHRPGSPNRGKASSVPMHHLQIGQLARWTEVHKFKDFLFLLGFRRRGCLLVPEPATESILRRRRISTGRSCKNQ